MTDIERADAIEALKSAEQYSRRARKLLACERDAEAEYYLDVVRLHAYEASKAFRSGERRKSEKRDG